MLIATNEVSRNGEDIFPPLAALMEPHPVLVQCCRVFSHNESAVRKVGVFCMVSLHTVMGEELKPHLSKLSISQMKLLDLYIKKQAANGHL
ncbi:CLIP-associating protein 2-like isoform X6 [Dysidea avara]|uniref:CLIP-associating protein 2-like isoform X6 n=1 Tax=Dysidea avara TaxID=196820 RepID=UPI00332BB9DF